MTVRNQKDSNRLESIRFIESTDKNYFSLVNRPLEEMEQRDNDLDRIFTPARGFRVRQTIPASGDVQVETGVYVVSGTVITIPSTSSVTIPAAGVGNIRIDLLSFNLESGLVVRTAGAEQVSGVGFASLVKPSLPASDGSIPLAYVYVDDVPTSFSEIIAINTAGHIQDVRLAPGASLRLLEDTAGNLLADTAGGSVGTSARTVRADHRHPLNVSDAVNPQTLTPGNAAATGSSGFYARRDHVHLLATEGAAGVLKADIAGGAVGAASTVVRADHQHPLNVDATPPANISATAAAVGTAGTYARRDHVHLLPDDLNKTVAVVTQVVNDFSGSITVPAGTWLIEVFGRYHQSAFSSVQLTIDGTAADVTGDFGDQDGTGYVVVFGSKQVSGAGSYAFAMTNASAFSGGGPYMYAKAIRLGA